MGRGREKEGESKIVSVLCAKLWYGKRTGMQAKHVRKRKKIITRKDCSSSEEKVLYLIDT